MELENLRAKEETQQRLRERHLELERDRILTSARRITFTAAAAAAATTTKTTTTTTTTSSSTTRVGVMTKDATTRRRIASLTAWVSTWKRKKERRGRRRSMTPETLADQKKLKGIWITGRSDTKCWIKTQSWKKQPGGQSQLLNSLSLDGRYHQILLSTLQQMSHRTEFTNVSASTRKLHGCCKWMKEFSPSNWQNWAFSKNQKNTNP